MIHYSCDRCKRIINPEEDLRYVVKLEVEAAMEPVEVDEFDDDRDHLLEVQEILECLEDSDSELVSDDLYQRRRFDLCADCYRCFIKDPLGQDARARFGFSQN
jgi:hypothetical protein